ncbi:transient receptor potential cation channel subfamily A member 1 homolog [Dreissena polymorpha]|uniref:transient receptor potential cation channel subfamily A member 1 homolog n=1 Tax=Dreissena polymorpha TaxID=45954 RepID=UPI002264CEEF|nr:transient receptor potential cation channel subfamily A member 1 homolog [Dreissena polymorpha]
MSAVHPLENHVSLSQLDDGAAKASADAVAPLEDVTYIPKTDITRLEEFNLFQCARNGDFEGAKNLLGNPKVKASINNNDADGLTPLHLAARYNYFELVKLLVENGAEVDTEDNERMTPLMYACRLKRKRTKSRESMAKLSLLDSPKFSTSMTMMDILGGKKIDTDAQAIHFLISHGANVAHKDAYHMTPLHHAALRGDEVACEQLLIYAKQGVNVNAQDVQRMSPLHTAVCQSHSDIVRQLLKAGADARSKDEDLSTPLHEAATIGNTIIGSLIFDNCVLADGTPDVDKENLLLLDKDEDGNTPFVLAVGAGKTKFIQFLIKKGADINVSNNMRMTPLHLAAIDGDVQIMEILVEKGAKIDVMNQEQQTPLHKACTHNSVACIEYLLKKGANKEAKDFENFTPLALAVVHGHVRVVQMLLAAGSDVTVEDKNDSTLVFLAAEENKLDVLKVLMTTPKIKELINHRDEWNNSPLHVASQNGHVNVVKFLIENGAMVTLKNDREQTPIHLAAIKGYVGVVQAIVAHDKTTLNDHDENSDTALHLAASNGHVQLVHVLLTLGANHEIMNSNLQTPIAAAAANGHLKVVELLVRAGAFIDIPDKLGLTPLLLASMNGHFNVVEYLLERQADVTLTDKQGLNCLDLAVKYDQQEVVMDILKSDVWENALRNTTIENGCVCTPLRRLIRKMPEAAEKVFDNCITSKKVDGGPNEKAEMFEVKYNFEFLDDLYSITHWKEKKKRKRGEPIINCCYSGFSFLSILPP